MMTTSVTTESNSLPMKCMEVWGGNGSRQNHFVRPGIDLWIQCKEADTRAPGGKDLCMISSCASGRITRLMLADVCSSKAAFTDLAEKLRVLMKQNINSIRHTKMVRNVNQKLQDSSGDGCYATLMIGTFFSLTRMFSLCNTGHPPPLLYKVKESKWSVLRKIPHDLPASAESSGVVNSEEYQYFETKLEQGDMVFSYSNSLAECLSESGRTLGVYGLLDRIGELDPTQPDSLVSSLVEQIRHEHPSNLNLDDDVTALLCQATATKVSWWDNLLAPLRFFQGVSDHTKIL